MVGQLLKFRRATGEQRQQLKWLLSGATICIVGVVLGNTLSSEHGVLGALAIIGWVGIAALPAGIGVGVLKYRLFEIDRLISRTVSYLIITGLLVGVFVGIVALATECCRSPRRSPSPPRRWPPPRCSTRCGDGCSTSSIGASTAARYDAEAIVAAFTLKLRDAVDLDTVRRELLAAVDHAVAPAHASVWIRPPGPRFRT